MLAQKLIDSIDNKFDAALMDKKPVSVEELIESSEIDNNSKPIVSTYLTNVHELYSKFQDTIMDEMKKDRKNWGMHRVKLLGQLVVTPGIGAFIGGAIGFAVNGVEGAAQYSEQGYLAGFLIEFVFNPFTNYAGRHYLQKQLSKCDPERDEHRQKAILDLKELYSIPAPSQVQ